MPAEYQNRKVYLPVFAAAGTCLFLIRSGFLAFFFLVPLGFIAYKYDRKIAWAASLLALMGDVALTFGTAVSKGFPLMELGWNLLYFAVMIGVFAWITVPPLSFAGLSLTLRLMTGSCFAAVIFSIIFIRLLSSSSFLEYSAYLLNALISKYSSSGPDVVQNTRIEMLSAETVLQIIKSIMLRGGSLVSCVLLFSICRQISFFLANFFRRKDTVGTSSAGTSSRETSTTDANTLVNFHINPALIWIFSFSLLLVVLLRVVKLEIPEIILWNILVFCAILYFAQGLGILQFFLIRMPPFLRLILSVVFIALLFSPLLNALFLGGVILLGAVENWVPFRASEKNSPPSTPGAGNVEK